MIYIFIICIFICSCSHNVSTETYLPPDFITTHTVEIVPLNESLLVDMPSKMWKVDSLLILGTRSADNDAHFQILSATNGTYMGNFGNIGRGNNELLDYARASINVAEKRLFATDVAGKCILIDLKDMLTNNIQQVQSYTVSYGTDAQDVYCTNDKLLLLNGYPKRFCLTDMQCRDTLAYSNDYPTITQIDDDEYKKRVYYSTSSSFAVKPNGEQFCNFTRNGMLMEIFTIKHNDIRLSKRRYFYKTKMKDLMKGDDDCIRGCSCVQATDKYIYALYYDTPINDKNALPQLGIFDWSGNEICKYEFTEKVVNFCISSTDDKVYCWIINPLGEEYLGYFDLI